MKIIIVGAGIAGLLMGSLCQRAGMSVKIYEKATALRHIGGGILIWPHGLRYLSWLGLADCLAPFSVSVRGCRIIGHRGNQVFSEDYAALYDLLGGGILPIDRSLLQQALLSQLNKNTLTLNKNCVAIFEDEEKARVRFADGSEEDADLVIGADGIFSTIRKQMHPRSQLHYTNYCWWGGIVESKYVPTLNLDEVYIAMAEKKMCVVWPTMNNHFMWYLPCKMPLNQFYSLPDGVSHAATLAKDWQTEVKQLVSAPTIHQQFHLPIYAQPTQTHWVSARTVLIGDAAHALGPVLGQGASKAIEDVFILFQLLKNQSNDIPAMLKHYQELRRPRYDRLSVLENQSSEAMISETIEALESFETQIANLDLATVYQEIIGLVNEEACLQLANSIQGHAKEQFEL